MLNKREYLATVQDRISCEADEVAEWGAYAGSMRLLEACWSYFEGRAKVYNVDPATAGVYVLNCKPGREGLEQAMTATGFDRRGRVVRVVG